MRSSPGTRRPVPRDRPTDWRDTGRLDRPCDSRHDPGDHNAHAIRALVRRRCRLRRHVLRSPSRARLRVPAVDRGRKNMDDPQGTLPRCPSPGTDCPQCRRTGARSLGSLTPAGKAVIGSEGLEGVGRFVLDAQTDELREVVGTGLYRSWRQGKRLFSKRQKTADESILSKKILGGNQSFCTEVVKSEHNRQVCVVSSRDSETRNFRVVGDSRSSGRQLVKDCLLVRFSSVNLPCPNLARG